MHAPAHSSQEREDDEYNAEGIQKAETEAISKHVDMHPSPGRYSSVYVLQKHVAIRIRGGEEWVRRS